MISCVCLSIRQKEAGQLVQFQDELNKSELYIKLVIEVTNSDNLANDTGNLGVGISFGSRNFIFNKILITIS